MPRRRLNWSAALRGLKADRTFPHLVREEGSRFSSGNLSAWRGRSGQRYVVRIGEALGEVEPAVVIAVARDPSGRASILAVGLAPGFVPPAGANETHVHRLAETGEDRAAVVADLTPMTPSDAIRAMLAFYVEGEGDPEAVLFRVTGDPDEAGVAEAESECRADLIHGVFAACGCDLAALGDVVRDRRPVIAVLRASLDPHV